MLTVSYVALDFLYPFIAGSETNIAFSSLNTGRTISLQRFLSEKYIHIPGCQKKWGLFHTNQEKSILLVEIHLAALKRWPFGTHIRTIPHLGSYRPLLRPPLPRNPQGLCDGYWSDLIWTWYVLLPLGHFNFFGPKFQTFVVCFSFSFFNKLSLEKKLIRKAERVDVKQRRSRWDGSSAYISRLIWIYAVCKSLLSPPVSGWFWLREIDFAHMPT